MGIILDSNVIIAGERHGHTVVRILEQLQRTYGNMPLGLSVVTVVELAHGVERTSDPVRRLTRQSFLNELIRDLPVYSVTVETALLAGRIEGEQASKGITIPFEDLLIAATALVLGFAVATANIRHFEAIPDLNVIPT